MKALPLLLALMLVTLLAGCSSNDGPASSAAGNSVDVDQSAPITGGALFNGN